MPFGNGISLSPTKLHVLPSKSEFLKSLKECWVRRRLTKASGFACNSRAALTSKGLSWSAVPPSGLEHRTAVRPPAIWGRDGNPARRGRAAGAGLGS